MEDVVRDFKIALEDENGYAVASCITPLPPKNDPGRLYSFYRSSNDYNISSNLRNALIYNGDLSKAEGNAWVEVFVAYWKAIGELLNLEELQNQGKAAESNWNKLYEAWKELVNQLIRGFTTNAFPAWTIPCLYVGGKYLRIFAIKADEQARLNQGEVTLNEGFQDDIVGAQKKNETLEDAARQVNRIFSCCVSDRYAFSEPFATTKLMDHLQCAL
jgi:COP9 signalosome complex subunit 12